jgi:hypothetical protein
MTPNQMIQFLRSVVKTSPESADLEIVVESEDGVDYDLKPESFEYMTILHTRTDVRGKNHLHLRLTPAKS